MDKQIKIALAGNPNCGKTTLFNALTGSNQFVGNWPGVTVEKKEGKLKKHDDVVIMDLPGIYSLSPYTLEEVVARNYLIGERPDAILNIIDGTNLERNLYLTTQLTELGIPVVIAVNMMDVVRKNGDQINVAELSRELEEQTSREVSLAASSIPMQYILPQLISDFHRENPDFRFLLRSGDSAAVHAAVLQGETHIGFVGAVLNTRELTYDCIATDPLVLVTPDTPRYRAMFDAGESGNALLGEPLIFREGGSGTQLAGQKFFTENGIDSGALNIVARIDNSEAVLRAVACGLGCAVVSGLAAGATKELLSFPLVGKNNEREIYMIRSRDRRPTKSARAFIDFLLDRRTLH